MILLLFCLVIFVVLYVLLKKRFEYWSKLGVPHPKPTLILGSSGRVISNQERLPVLLDKIYNDYKKYSYVGFFNLWQPALLIRDPETIKEVLIKQFNSFHDNWIEGSKSVDPAIAYNPFVLNSEEWNIIRKQLTPQFTSSKVKSMFYSIDDVCKKMVKYIEKQINTKDKSENVIEVKNLSARFTGDNVFSCGYGLDGKSFEVDVPDTFLIGEQMSSTSKIVQFKQTLALFFPSLHRILNQTMVGAPVPKTFWDIILGAIQYRKDNNIEKNDLLDFLKNLKQNSLTEVSDGLIVAHAFTMFLDGFETSSITFSYALLELALNPDVQNTARMEIETVLDRHDGKWNSAALQEMEYIENIIFETLRKYSSIQFISRVCTEDCVFPPADKTGTGDSVIINKGVQVFISPVSIHNDPDYYPDPEQFNPDRFKEEAVDARPKYSFLGFGDGPRTCLGRNFALIQLKMGLVAILNKFELKVNKNTSFPIEQLNIHMFNSPKDDILLDFYPLSSEV